MTPPKTIRVRDALLAFAGVLAVSTTLFAQPSAPQAPSSDNLNMRFANGIAAVAEGKIITVDDIRREISPMIQELQRTSRDEREFNQRLEALQDDTIQALVDRVLIVKDFYSDEKRRIPSSYVGNIAARWRKTSFTTICGGKSGSPPQWSPPFRFRSFTMRISRNSIRKTPCICASSSFNAKMAGLIVT